MPDKDSLARWLMTGTHVSDDAQIVPAASSYSDSDSAEIKGSLAERTKALGFEELQDATVGLNDAQREAVTTTEGYVRVIAGAGSGKTRALTHRFAYLVCDLGIMPSNILCVTFTNKAAHEMRTRIRRLTGGDDTGYINTFHGFCVSVLQEDSHAIGYPKRFLVLDNSDIDAMLRTIYDERGLTLRDKTFTKARDMFEMRKLLDEPNYWQDLIDLSPEHLKQKYEAATNTDDILFYGYLYQQKKCFGLDYNDLIVLVLRIFERHEDIRLKWQQRIQYLMVDEFQDIDALQYRLMEVLSAYHGNLFVVGDPDQTIYTWRGANVRFLLDFDTHFPGTKTILMTDNYRSTPQIVSAANSLIAHNDHRIPKDLIAHAPNGPLIRGHHAKNAEAEAAWITDSIEHMHTVGIAYRDICILYRAHYVTRPIEESFVASEIPYAIYSGINFFDRAEVKDALSYLRLIAYHDDLSFERIANKPRRNLGEKRMRFLRSYADAHRVSLYDALKDTLDDPEIKGSRARNFIDLIEGYTQEASRRPISELLQGVLHASGYERMLRTEGSQERLDNLAELKQAVYEYETTCGEEATLAGYLSHVALFSSLDAESPKDAVKMMTIHAAKGLEFPHVFIASMNEGVIPSRKTKTVAALEEERRLAFVAITRAQMSLHLTCADGMGHDGVPQYPSRFLFDISPSAIEFSEPFPDPLVQEAQRYFAYRDRILEVEESGPAFSVGDRIDHPAFGTGTVIALDRDTRAYSIQFDTMNTPRSISWCAKIAACD